MGERAAGKGKIARTVLRDGSDHARRIRRSPVPLDQEVVVPEHRVPRKVRPDRRERSERVVAVRVDLAVGVGGVGAERHAVERVDEPARLVALRGVGVVAGHEREVERVRRVNVSAARTSASSESIA